MGSGVRTGAFGYLQYGLETAFGTPATNINKVFGLEQRISGWNYTNNKITVAQLNSVFPQTFAYGQAQGTTTVGFVMSNPWWADLLFNKCDRTVMCGTPDTITWAISTKLIQPITVEIGYDTPMCDVVRNLQGTVVNSLRISTSVGEVVKGSVDLQYSIENDGGATPLTLDMCPAPDTDNFPYTFAYGRLEFPDGSCNVIAEVQDAEVNFTINANLLWGLNNNQAVATYKGLYEVTGRFKASYVDKTEIRKLYAQVKGGINNQTELRVQPTLSLIFDNGLSGTNKKTIEVRATNLGIDSHSVTLEPNEPVFEDISWQMSGLTVVAQTDTAIPTD